MLQFLGVTRSSLTICNSTMRIRDAKRGTTAKASATAARIPITNRRLGRNALTNFGPV